MQAEILEEDPWGSLTAGGRSTANCDAYEVVPSSASPPSSADPMDGNRQGEESIEAQSRHVYVWHISSVCRNVMRECDSC